MTVLVVDDQQVNRKLLRVLLQAEGFTVVEAADGGEALAMLSRGPVDVIISDILMPGMDGFRFCYEVRTSARFSHLPFIIYTSTYTTLADERLAMKAGADRFIRKPCPTAELVAMVKEVAHPGRRPCPQPSQLPDELEVTRQYSDALIRKLEQKNAELEQAVCARAEAEEELRALNESLETQVAERSALAEARAGQLQTLVVQLTEAEERERRRIAELLHDELQQTLVGARMRVQAIQREHPGLAALEAVDNLLEASITQSRRLSHEMDPAPLRHADLAEALRSLGRQMQEHYDLEVELQADDAGALDSPALRVLLFRSVQELLFNVVKHAGTPKALVRLECAQGLLRVTVADQGKGFDPGVLSSSPGLGLLSITDRIQAIGGEFSITSSPGAGSWFVLSIPCQG